MQIIRIIIAWIQLAMRAELHFWPLMIIIALMIAIAEIRLVHRGGQAYPMIYQFIDSRRPEAFDSRRWIIAYRLAARLPGSGRLANFIRDAIMENGAEEMPMIEIIRLAMELAAHCQKINDIDQQGSDMIGALSEAIRAASPMDQLAYDQMQEDIWALIDDQILIDPQILAEDESIISAAIARLAAAFDLRPEHDPAFMIEFDRRMRELIFLGIQDDQMNDMGLQDPWGLEAKMSELADLALQHGFLIADQDQALDMIDNAIQDLAEEL